MNRGTILANKAWEAEEAVRETSEYKDCKEAWDKVWEAFGKAEEATPKGKTWDEAWEAMEATPEYKEYDKAKEAMEATPEWKTRDEAWEAYWEAKKKYEETVTRYLV